MLEGKAKNGEEPEANVDELEAAMTPTVDAATAKSDAAATTEAA